MTIWSELQSLAFSQRWVNAAGVATRVVEAGDGAQALVLLHGVQGHLETWLRSLPALAARYRVIAIDMLGHGLTGKPDQPYEIADYMRHALAVADALEVTRPVWIGSSLGGWVAARIAAQHPARTAALVLASTAGLTADPKVMAALKSLGERAAMMPGLEGVRERLQFVIHDPLLVTEELVQTRAQIYARDDYRAALKHVNVLQQPEVRARNLLSHEELQTIRAPTLVVWTDHDPTATLATGREYARAIPGARFEIIADCSHIPSWEKPAEFNRLVLEFLAAHSL